METSFPAKAEENVIQIVLYNQSTLEWVEHIMHKKIKVWSWAKDGQVKALNVLIPVREDRQKQANFGQTWITKEPLRLKEQI